MEMGNRPLNRICTHLQFCLLDPTGSSAISFSCFQQRICFCLRFLSRFEAIYIRIRESKKLLMMYSTITTGTASQQHEGAAL